jgi:prepilin-type processing-associated H-X9-DG protein/prepilin-type N-terminal cleavage/methylation domain-containing protein
MGKISRSRAGFTLIELLVVVGIIAILLAILIPSLAAARRQANLLKCSSNLRQVYQGCMLHVQEHNGYLPLAGELDIEAPTSTSIEAIAAAVGDPVRKRYTYACALGTNHVVAPLPGAIAQYLGWRNLSFNDWYVLDQELNNTRGVWQLFMCPQTDSFNRALASNNPIDQAAMMVISQSGWISHYWSTNSDFAMNEGVLGFHYDQQYKARRLAGKLNQVLRPAETMLFCDAKLGKIPPNFPGNFQCPWATMAPALNAIGPITMADVLAQNNKVEPMRADIDKPRHKGRMNICFVDGHVENVPIGKGDLERVYLAAK